MPDQCRKSVTLIELLIAMSLLAVLVLGINSIDVFSRFHLFSTERRARLQNDVSLCLEHMTKSLAYAIGNESITGSNSVVFISPNSTSTSRLSVFVDSNGNGVKDSVPPDYWAGYSFDSSAHTLTYYSQCTSSSCSSYSSSEVLSSKITAFSADSSLGTYINVSLTACWKPGSTTASCGSSDNPSFTMATTIALPAVSNN